MLSAIATALEFIFSWPVFAFVVIGTLIGLIFGAIPGLGGLVALALLLPLSISLGPETTMVLFGSTLGGVAFGGSISAILINVPGTAPNAATLLDGYPMTKDGRAGEALAASAVSSGIGAIIGLAILLLLLPVARRIILLFASPEYFLLAIFGISTIAFITRGGFVKGLVAGGFGLICAFIGFDPFTGNIRYNFPEYLNLGFGELYFFDGIKLVPAIIGVFAIAEALDMMSKERETIAGEGDGEAPKGLKDGIKGTLSRPKLLLRSSAIGVLVGMIPGVGGAVANFISYISANQSAENPETFGEGDIRGVIASEAANDAKDGGALVPTLAFGIPGSSTMAIILGALTLHGIQPGATLLEEELNIAFLLIFGLLFANILASVLGLVTANTLSKITRIPTTYIIPLVLAVSMMGAYAMNEAMGDVVMATIFGFIGYFMVRYDYSRVAFIIALVLGGIAEQAFERSITAYDAGWGVFFTRPISILLILGLVGLFAYPTLKNIYASRAA